jgi:hypothetical protein
MATRQQLGDILFLTNFRIVWCRLEHGLEGRKKIRDSYRVIALAMTKTEQSQLRL